MHALLWRHVHFPTIRVTAVRVNCSVNLTLNKLSPNSAPRYQFWCAMISSHSIGFELTSDFLILTCNAFRGVIPESYQ